MDWRLVSLKEQSGFLRIWVYYGLSLNIFVEKMLHIREPNPPKKKKKTTKRH